VVTHCSALRLKRILPSNISSESKIQQFDLLIMGGERREKEEEREKHVCSCLCLCVCAVCVFVCVRARTSVSTVKPSLHVQTKKAKKQAENDVPCHGGQYQCFRA
jgi:hypothetical protein